MAEQSWTVRSAADDPDLTLLRAVAKGDEGALGELYARRGPSLLIYLIGRLGDRQLAEEVLQDVMLAAWKGAARFRGQSSVRTWLLAIARHRAINAQRKRKLARAPLDESMASPAAEPLSYWRRTSSGQRSGWRLNNCLTISVRR
jgi:RNA polymerase sigma-70 factor (ECF subfamily)